MFVFCYYLFQMLLQVPPAELESIILTHPDIAEAAVTGVLDNQAGELPCAFVILKDGRKTTEKDIQDFVKSRSYYYIKNPCHSEH